MVASSKQWREYRDRGYSTLPIKPKDKCPGQPPAWGQLWTGLNKWQNLCAELPTDSQLKQWESWPDCGIGLALGQASGLIAIDFDNDVDGLHAKIMELLPDTPASKKGAKGHTRLYRMRDEKSQQWKADIAGKKETVVELLAQGRQTVLPPSIHPNGMAYEWLGDSLLNINRDDIPYLPSNFVSDVSAIMQAYCCGTKNFVPVKHYFEGDCLDDITDEQIAHALDFINSDDYHTWVEVGMALKQHMGLNGYHLWNKWSAKSCKYDEKSVRPKWESFKRVDIKIGTLFYHAKMAGWHPSLFKPTTATAHVPLPAMFSVDDDGVIEDCPIAAPAVASFPLGQADTEFPSHLIYPVGLCGEIAEWITSTATRPQPILSIAGGLSAVATAKGHRVKSETNLRTNLLMVSLAASGSGKDHPRECVDSLLYAADLANMVGGEPASGPGLIKTMHDQGGIVLFQLDEIGRLLMMLTSKQAATYQTETLKIIMELFSRAKGVFRGKQYATAEKGERLDIINPHLCINGQTVPKNFFSALRNREMIDGFLARWLVFESKEFAPAVRNGGQVGNTNPPAAIIEKMRAIADMSTNVGDQTAIMSSFNINPKTIPFSPPAAKIRDNLLSFVEAEREREYKLNTGLDCIWARTVEHAIKIALTLQQGDHINAEDMQWAATYMRYCSSALVQYARENAYQNDMQDDIMQSVLARIPRDGKISRSDITRLLLGIPAKIRDAALHDLVNAKILKLERDDADPERTIYYSRLPS